LEFIPTLSGFGTGTVFVPAIVGELEMLVPLSAKFVAGAEFVPFNFVSRLATTSVPVFADSG
jgi:hypothetical protein